MTHSEALTPMGEYVGEAKRNEHARYIKGLVDFVNIIDYIKPKRILDCGYGGGMSHAIWLTAWSDCEVYCITPEERGMFDWETGAVGMDAIGDMPISAQSRFHFARGAMQDIDSIWPDKSEGYFDMVFIDTEHTYDAQIMQCEVGLKSLRSGGVISGHDYERRSVKESTDNTLHRVGNVYPEYIVLPDGTQIFYCVKGE